jgi:adenylyltransferase/sulfurtransferase
MALEQTQEITDEVQGLDAVGPDGVRADLGSQPTGSTPTGDDRYSRQVLFSGIGQEGQARLAASHVALVGCGATGAAAASLLARAGVGTLTLIDRDFVEESNLQRQVLFDEADARESLPKAEAARAKIALFNGGITVRAQVADLVPANIHALLEGASLILDATDNFQTRYLLNDYAVKHGKPWIYAGAVGAYAVSMNILPGETACLACIFPEAPGGTVETCDTAGILNTAVNLAASIEATEALKYLVGARAAMRRTLISHDLWSNERSEVSARTPRAGCRVCQGRDFRHLSGQTQPQITLCGRNSVQIHEHGRPVDFAALAARLAPHGSVRHNSMTLRFWRGEHTMTVFADGRAVIQGTTDVTQARSLYARFLGT